LPARLLACIIITTHPLIIVFRKIFSVLRVLHFPSAIVLATCSPAFLTHGLQSLSSLALLNQASSSLSLFTHSLRSLSSFALFTHFTHSFRFLHSLYSLSSLTFFTRSSTDLTHFLHSLLSLSLLTLFTHSLLSLSSLTLFTHPLHSLSLLTLFTHSLYSLSSLTLFTHPPHAPSPSYRYAIPSVIALAAGDLADPEWTVVPKIVHRIGLVLSLILVLIIAGAFTYTLFV
jgi:hypothetical protein